MMTALILFLSAFVFGAVFIHLRIGNKPYFKYFLSFSGAFLFGLTVLHFIPELFQHFNPLYGIFILLGFSFQIILEFLTKGLDHGHFHFHHGKPQLGFAAIIGLLFHSFFEASPLSMHGSHDHFGSFLLWGLVLHKVPVSIFLGTVLSQYFKEKWKAYLILLLFAIMAPLGLYLGTEIAALASIQDYFLAFVIGIFLYISTTILYEVNENHSFNTFKFIAIIIGFSVAALSSLLA